LASSALIFFAFVVDGRRSRGAATATCKLSETICCDFFHAIAMFAAYDARMDIAEIIRNADSATKALSALSVYLESLRHVPAIPDWCLRVPLEGEADLHERMAALVAVINLTSQNLRHRECGIAKQALRVFAAATWRLRSRDRPSAG
jgi:hypothetical protein